MGPPWITNCLGQLLLKLLMEFHGTGDDQGFHELAHNNGIFQRLGMEMDDLAADIQRGLTVGERRWAALFLNFWPGQ